MKSSSGLEKKPLEKWLQWRLENTPQGLTFTRLNENKPLRFLKISLLWWEAVWPGWGKRSHPVVSPFIAHFPYQGRDPRDASWARRAQNLRRHSLSGTCDTTVRGIFQPCKYECPKDGVQRPQGFRSASPIFRYLQTIWGALEDKMQVLGQQVMG